MKALVVDGYNVIHKIRHLEAALDRSLYEAREAVTKLAVEYQRKIGGIKEVHVVFDGKNDYRDLNLNIPPNQVFSKSGDGDRAIIRMVQRLSGRYHVMVVSDDNFVKNNSRAYNASTISISEFTVAIKKNNAPKRNDAGSDKEIDPKTAQEITEQLRKQFGSTALFILLFLVKMVPS